MSKTWRKNKSSSWHEKKAPTSLKKHKYNFYIKENDEYDIDGRYDQFNSFLGQNPRSSENENRQGIDS